MEIKQILNTKPNRTIGLNTELSSSSSNSNPIAYSTLDSEAVDMLLKHYSALIDRRYISWFAKKFYRLGFDQIHWAASEARQEGHGDHKKLFAYKINKLSPRVVQ